MQLPAFLLKGIRKMTLPLAIVISSHFANFRRAEFGDRIATRPLAHGIYLRWTFFRRVAHWVLVQSAELFAETRPPRLHLAATR